MRQPYNGLLIFCNSEGAIFLFVSRSSGDGRHFKVDNVVAASRLRRPQDVDIEVQCSLVMDSQFEALDFFLGW